ncbi:hypothetical protein B0A53_03828 [Rhodotorula sp. CCFEE 5036]|nr:hypothetical protein B0A53_03828 [Rhodotorula sp. CCFEE 5036]
MELALAPTLAAQPPVPTRPNRATQRSVPAFLNKLYSMVADQSTDDLIRWSDDGDSFFVPSADRFGKELLPRFFKHSNFGSFVRQLNMYGFHKVPHLQQGVLKRDQSEEADVLEFSNPHFMRGQPDLLCMIKRQKAGKGETAAAAAVAAAAAGSSLSLDGRAGSSSSAAAATGGSSSAASLNIATLLSDLAAIRKHQTAISADLKDLQARNHALWQEAVQSREKHKKQEETINKILRFLAGVFGGQVLDAGATHPQVVEGVSPASSSAASPPQTGGTAAASAGTSQAGGGTNGSSSATMTGGSGSSGTRKGNGPRAGVVLMPKSRLLLEDVKGRQRQRRAALRELDGEEDEEEDDDEEEERLGGRSRRQPRPRRRRVKTEEEEDERNDDNGVEIEEIPLLNAAEDEEDMPVISTLITSGSTALTRAPSHSHSAYLPTTTTTSSSSSSSRFTALPSPAPAFASDPPLPHPPTSANANGSSSSSSSSLIDPAQYNLPPEALKALLTAAGDNPQALQDFFLRATSTNPTSNGNGNYNPHQGALIPSSSAAGPSSFIGTSSSVAPPLSSSSPWTSSLAGPSAPASTSSSVRGGGATTSSALLPYSYAQPHYTSNPLDFGTTLSSSSSSTNIPLYAATTPTNTLGMTSAPISASTAALPSPVNFETAFAENNDVLSSVLTEKADIDQRTAALENQIARLLDHLPDDAREQVENEAANGDNSSWAGIDWENYTNDDGGVDFDKMLAQLSEISSNGEAPIDYSELLSNNALDPALSGAASSISSAPTPPSTSTAMIDPSLYGLGTESQHQQQQQQPQAYEVTSPAETPTASGGNLRAEEEGEGQQHLASPASSIHSFASTASSRRGPVAAAGGGGGGKGKKRKSDAIASELSTTVGGGGDDEPAAGAGARRSTRRKRS